MVDGEPGRFPPQEERSLHEANAAAVTFFRRELLMTRATWPAELLKDWGVQRVLDPWPSWQVGYAPDSGTRLIDHLQKLGIGRETMMRAGLMSWTDDGRVVDRYRDQLVMVSRDQRLEPVGFVGIDRDGRARSITPETPVHRPAEALIGVLEQIDVLAEGATAVIVDHPLDALAIELASRHAGGQGYVGIPLLGSAISTAQAEILRQYSVPDRVIVTVPDRDEAGERAVRTALALSFVFDHVRLFERPSGSLFANPGQLKLLADIVVEQPLDSTNDNHYDSQEFGDPGPGL
jgi:DNA primase